MRIKQLIAAAFMIVIMAACSSNNEKMTWEEFKSKEVSKLQLQEISDDAYGKVLKKGEPEVVTFHYTITADIAVTTLTDNPVSTKKISNIVDINEKDHSVAAFIVENAGKGAEMEIYMPSEVAKELGFCDSTEFEVVKVTVNILDVVAPSWEISYKGKDFKLNYGMSVAEVHEMLGTPADAANNILLTFIYRDGKTQYMLNFEEDKLTSVDNMTIE